jgi:hypothetical protein
MVEIVAYSDENAYTIFETMNDRGLNLTPSEMLKGFLLSRFHQGDKRQKANELWKKAMMDLKTMIKMKTNVFSSHGCVLNMLIQYARVKLVQKMKTLKK